jgi:hypothetical protein
MRKAWACIILGFTLPVQAEVCGAALSGQQVQIVRHEGWVVAYAPRSWPVPTGEHFELDLQVCDAAAPVTRVQVDADMPLHKHGMNYLPTVTRKANGVFLATGLMFHMPGKWRFIFDLESGSTRTRLTHEVDVE